MSEWERSQIIIPLQKKLATVDFLAELLGLSVSGEFILPLFSTLYWCLDAHKCNAGIWLVPVSEIANGLIKWLFRRGRPGWVDSRVRILTWTAEYSFPSSHAQLAFVLAQFFINSSRHPQAVTKTPAGLAYAYAASVALSRVHAGVHYPSDVLVGSLWGLGTAQLYERLLPMLLAADPGTARGRLAALSAPVIVAAALVLVRYRAAYRARQATPDPPEWRENALKGKHGKKHSDLDPVNEPIGLYTGMLGVMFGLAIGQSLKHLLPHLPYPPNARAAVLRAVLGNIGLIGLFEGIAAMTPKKPISVYTALRFLKYAMVPVYILLLAPVCFLKVGV